MVNAEMGVESMSRRHTPGRRTRKKRPETVGEQVANQVAKTYHGKARKLPTPEIIILAPRIRPESAQEAPEEPSATESPPKPKTASQRRAEVLADMKEEARRWR